MSDNTLSPKSRWHPRLAFEVALLLEGSGETMDDVLERHGITAMDMVQFRDDPQFIRQVQSYRDEIRDKGVTFKVKARAQAEELLTTSWQLIHDPTTTPAVKADLIKSTVRWAGLEPKNTTTEGTNTSGVRIVINMGGSSPQMVEATLYADDATDDPDDPDPDDYLLTDDTDDGP